MLYNIDNSYLYVNKFWHGIEYVEYIGAFVFIQACQVYSIWRYSNVF